MNPRAESSRRGGSDSLAGWGAWEKVPPILAHSRPADVAINFTIGDHRHTGVPTTSRDALRQTATVSSALGFAYALRLVSER